MIKKVFLTFLSGSVMLIVKFSVLMIFIECRLTRCYMMRFKKYIGKL